MRKALIVSLVLHIIVGVALLTRKMSERSQTFVSGGGPRKPIQVKTLTEKDFQKRLAHALDKEEKMQIVQSDDQLKNDKAPEAKSTEKTYLSKNNQVVDKNTRAPRVGKFKNVLKEGLQAPAGNEAAQSPPPDSGKKTAEAKPQNKKVEIGKQFKETKGPVTARDLFNLAPNPKDLEQQNSKVARTGRLRSPASVQPNTPGTRTPGQGLSATDDYLRDVAVGANTILNTKEFKFYSFYERIREKLAYQWHSRLDQEVQTIMGSGQSITADQRTKVEVRLDKAGQVVSIKVVHSSGYNGLDRAATQAFYMAAPFPNPPAGMIGDNNEVALSWDFVVVAEASSGVTVDVRQSGF